MRKIKQDETLKLIPVVVFTTSNNPKDIEACYRQGIKVLLNQSMKRFSETLKPHSEVCKIISLFSNAKNRSTPLKEQPLDLTGIRVLAIDDEPDSRELLSVMMAQARAKVMTVASAAEFLAALTSFQPDVLVSDIGMPEVDGHTLLRQVRSLPPEQGGQVPAIALTAYTGEIERQQAIAAAFQKHIAKPAEPDQLVRAIEWWRWWGDRTF